MNQISLGTRLFIALGVCAGLFLVAFLVPWMMIPAYAAITAVLTAAGVETYLLFRVSDGVSATREMTDRLSNGDENPVTIHLENVYRFQADLTVIDEVPEQFQWRDMRVNLTIPPGESENLTYSLRPVVRGEYEFGQVILLVSSGLRFVRRIYRCGEPVSVPVYPSFLQMKKYQLLAMSNRLTEVGVKPIRRLGHSTEFEQIKEYVRGDDYRTINWKATARSNKLMVNQYMDERSQQIYCLIDKSRVMKMPFEQMALLDYAINASLVLCNIAQNRHDKSGLLTFSKEIDQFLPAAKDPRHMRNLQEMLYKQETEFLEANLEKVHSFVSRRIPHRSLLVLFTNFESQAAMRRQMVYLKRIARRHLLLVVFFENTELTDLLTARPKDTEGIYVKSIGEQFSLDKRLIVQELERNGIQAILSRPSELTVNTINKYLEIKARSMI